MVQVTYLSIYQGYPHVQIPMNSSGLEALIKAEVHLKLYTFVTESCYLCFLILATVLLYHLCISRGKPKHKMHIA